MHLVPFNEIFTSYASELVKCAIKCNVMIGEARSRSYAEMSLRDVENLHYSFSRFHAKMWNYPLTVRTVAGISEILPRRHENVKSIVTSQILRSR